MGKTLPKILIHFLEEFSNQGKNGKENLVEIFTLEMVGNVYL